MSPEDVPSIALDLFDRVEEYADELSQRLVSGDEESEPELATDTAIIVFCENFFAQFFRNVLGVRITGLDQRAKMRAAKKRLELPRPARRQARRLVAQFEKLCDLWPDLQGRSYSVSVVHRTEFHLTYLPSLFERIEAWAEEAGEIMIASRSAEAAEYYADAAEGLSDE